MTDLSAIVRVILAQKRTIALLCASAAVSALILTYVIPEKYEAVALVLVRPEERVGLTAPTPTGKKEVLDLPPTANMPVETPSKTFIEVIKSRAVAERIVRLLALDKKKEPPTDGSWKARWERLKDDVIEGAAAAWSVMKFGWYQTTSPFDKAVDRVMTNIFLRSVKNTYLFEVKFRSNNPEEAAAVANTAAEMFVEHDTQASREEAKGHREFVGKQMDETYAELERARQALREFKERHKSILFREEAAEGIKVTGELEARLEKVNAELEGLLKDLTPEHPKVAKLQGEKESLLQAVRRRKTDLKELPEKEAYLERLKLNVKTAEANYELLNKEYEEARISEARRAREIRLASPAQVPREPKYPIKIYNVGVSVLLALMVGVGVTVAVDSMNPRLRTIEDVERVLGVPVLATIPPARD